MRPLVAAFAIIGLLAVNACSPTTSEAERAAAGPPQSEIVAESTEPTESTEFGQGAEVTVGSDYMDPSAAEAESAAAGASQSEVVAESTEPTESTEFGQGAEVTVGSDYMDPIAANSWVNIKNRSTWPVRITAYDFNAESRVQTVVLKPTEELNLWGWGSAVGKDVYTALSWCMDPEQTVGSCPGSTQVRASLGFENSIFYGSQASMTTYFKQPRNLPDNSERVGKSPHISADTTDTVTLQPAESHVFVPYPDSNDLNSLQFYVSRRQDQLTGALRKITRFGVIIEDAGSWSAP